MVHQVKLEIIRVEVGAFVMKNSLVFDVKDMVVGSHLTNNGFKLGSVENKL